MPAVTARRGALRTLLLGALYLLLAGASWGQPAVQYTTTALRLREGPSIDSERVLTMPRGSAVQVQSCSGGWCLVTYAGLTGYASAEYLSPEPRTGRGYINSRGEWVPSPRYSPDGPPAGATAECRDGTYSFSRSRRGTCSHHGGVRRWL